MITISDDVFRLEMDAILKKQNITKKSRNEKIGTYLAMPAYRRDEYLENEKEALTPATNIKSETEEQIDFVYRFRKKFPGVVLFSVRNDGSRSPREKVEQLAMGLWPGVSDLMCIEYQIAIEMKKSKDGVQSDKQKAFQHYCESIGWHYVLAEGAEDGMIKVNEIISKNTLLN